MTDLSPRQLGASYHSVRRIARRSGSNFYRSFWLLPAGKRDAMTALYAYARITDDLGDCDEPASLRKHWLNLWRQTTAMNLIGEAGGPVRLCEGMDELKQSAEGAKLVQHALEIMPAIRHTADQYSIPSRYLLEIIDGVLADQKKNRFDTYEQLEHYCYLVASAVGIACLHIWGFRSPLPMQAAVDCGLAFQLTNILRDISEDAARGRIYLPRQHYEQHGLDEDDLLHPRRDARLSCLIVDECERANVLFQSGWRVWDSLEDDGRPIFSMMWRTYRQLLGKIMNHPNGVIDHRVSLNLPERIGMTSRHFIGPMYRRLAVPPLEVRDSQNSGERSSPETDAPS